MIFLDDIFYHTWHNRSVCILLEVWDAYNLEIELGLRVSWSFNFFDIDAIGILDIVINYL